MLREQASNKIGKMVITGTCREYTEPCDDPTAEPDGVIGDNNNIGPIHDVLVTRHYGRYGIEGLI